jgi:serine O-acetyltransferase
MILTLRDVLRYCRLDAGAREISLGVRTFLADPISRFTVLLRFVEYAENSRAPLPVRMFLKLWFRRISIRLGFSVPPNVFGPGLAIVHYGLLVVAPTAVVGSYCRIHAGVNIGGGGGRSIPSSGRSAPEIGDRCYIGPGAKIYGAVRIGDDCAIGANAVVGPGSFRNGVTIAGNKAVIVSEKGSAGMIFGTHQDVSSFAGSGPD